MCLDIKRDILSLNEVRGSNEGPRDSFRHVAYVVFLHPVVEVDEGEGKRDVHRRQLFRRATSFPGFERVHEVDVAGRPRLTILLHHV